MADAVNDVAAAAASAPVISPFGDIDAMRADIEASLAAARAGLEEIKTDMAGEGDFDPLAGIKEALGEDLPVELMLKTEHTQEDFDAFLAWLRAQGDESFSELANSLESQMKADIEASLAAARAGLDEIKTDMAGEGGIDPLAGIKEALGEDLPVELMLKTEHTQEDFDAFLAWLRAQGDESFSELANSLESQMKEGIEKSMEEIPKELEDEGKKGGELYGLAFLYAMQQAFSGLSRMIGALVGKSISAALGDAEMDKELKGVLTANARDVEVLTKRYNKFAEAMENLTGVAKPNILEMLRAAEQNGLTGESAEKAAKYAIALGNAFPIPARAAARLTAALVQGKDAGLGTYFNALKGVEDEATRVAMATEMLERGFGAATESAKTAAGQNAALHNRMSALYGDIGKVLLPFQNAWLKIKIAALGAFKVLMESPLGKVVVSFGAAAAAAGGLLTAFAALKVSGMLGFFSNVAGQVKLLSLALFDSQKMMYATGVAAKALSMTIKTALITTGIGAVVVVIGLAIAGLVKFIQMIVNSKTWIEASGAASEKFKEAWIRVKMAFDEIGTAILGAIRLFGAAFGIDFLATANSFGAILGFMLDKVATWVLNAAKMFQAFVKNPLLAWDIIKQGALVAFLGIKASTLTILSSMFESHKSIFKNMLLIVQEFAKMAVGAFVDLGKGALNSLMNLAESLPASNAIKGALNFMGTSLQSFGDGAKAAIVGAVTVGADGIDAIGSGLKGAATEANAELAAAQGQWAGMMGEFLSGIPVLGDLLGGAGEKVATPIDAAADNLLAKLGRGRVGFAELGKQTQDLLLKPSEGDDKVVGAIDEHKEADKEGFKMIKEAIDRGFGPGFAGLS